MAGAHPSEQACDDSPYHRRCRPDPGRDCHDPPRHQEPPYGGRRAGRPEGAATSRPGLCPGHLRAAVRSGGVPPVRRARGGAARWWSSPSWRASGTIRSWAGSPGSRCGCSTSCGFEHGRLDQPVPANDVGGTLRVELNHADDGVLPPGFRTETNDARILSVALNLAARGPGGHPGQQGHAAAGQGGLGRACAPTSTATVRPATRPGPACPSWSLSEEQIEPAVRRRDARPRRGGRAALPHRPGAALAAWLGAGPGAAGQVGPAGPRRPGGVRAARPLGRAAHRPRPAARRVDRHRLAGRPGRHRQVGAGALRRAGGGDGAPPAQEGDRVPPAVRGRRPGAGLPAGLASRRRCRRGRRRSSTRSARWCTRT